MKTLASWLITLSLAGATAAAVRLSCDPPALTALQRHMAGCPVCDRSPATCPEAVAINRRQFPSAGSDPEAEMDRWGRGRAARD